TCATPADSVDRSCFRFTAPEVALWLLGSLIVCVFAQLDGDPAVADLHLDAFDSIGVVDVHIGHPDREAEGWAHTSTGDLAHLHVTSKQPVAGAQHTALGHLDRSEATVNPLLANRTQCVLSHEGYVLLQLHDPTEARLERVGLERDVVAIQRKLHLEPECVTCTETTRLDPMGLACGKDVTEHTARVMGGDQNL